MIVIVAIVLVKGGGGEDPKGETVSGLRGFPLRGSLANDQDAIDAAVKEWREEIADDEADEDEDDDGKDLEQRARDARRPDEDDDIAVLWIGRADEREDIAILESRGLAAELERRPDGESWFLRSERLRDEDSRGDFPIEVGESVIVPEGETWRYIDAGYSTGYEDAGDGMFRDGGGLSADGFFLPQRGNGDSVAIHITGVGGRALDPEDYDAFVAAIDGGYARPIWLAADRAEEALKDDERVSRPDDPPSLSLVWTGEVPSYKHAATVLQGNRISGPLSAALGYGETPGTEARSEDKDEGSVSLGTGQADRGPAPSDTFAAGAYTHLKDVPYLVLAGSGAVETVHAFVGDQEVTRKAPTAVVDARRFDSGDNTVVFGRTRDGQVVAPLD